MPTFDYTARDKSGREVSGTISGRDSAEVRSTLRNKELFLTDCHQLDRGTQLGAFLGRTRVKLSDLVVTSRQLATLVRAGLPIVEALRGVSEQTENPTLQEVLDAVREDVLSGRTLAEAMSEFPRVFDKTYVGLVEAGELGGTLDQTLEVAADQLDQEAEIREQVKSALTYPIIVIVATFGVVAFMLLFIVPVFAGIYGKFGAELPSITASLLSISAFATKWWWFMAVLGVVGYVGFRQYSRTVTGRRYIDMAKIRLPLVGKLLRKISIARFTQTWCGLTKGGVPILSALESSANTCGNVVIRDAVLEVRERVKDGAGIAVPLADSGQFPPMVTRMIASGEQSGNLDEMLAEVTRFYKRDIEHGIQRLTRLLEPIMTVVVGGIVLFVLLALYMPAFMLGGAVQR